ncbi:iron ABC transporter permease [Roseomonas gilardii subsp. gilardii]|uniref:ABC transporter permease n=1 Tax=Roseomonas gilardii TaxID=257708 RepID=UPI001FF90933|nr:iron ABC transporter permease [Roseomonas gilardii]UPG73625.1 iron ABC transporter permease [Roseomonas gilardii subsp. gilardii]
MSTSLEGAAAIRPALRSPVLRPATPLLSAAALSVTLLALLPLGFVLWATVQAGWSTTAALLFRPRVGDLLVNTLLLVLLSVPLCGVLALALAWLTERSDLPGARLWSWAAVAPLAVPAFVQSYAWVTLVPWLHGLAAGVLVSVIAYFPFLYLPVAAAMRRLDPALEDAAAALGEPPARVFRRVVLPQMRLALCGGALLVGLHLLAEYGLFAMIRFDTFTTAIIDQFQSSFNGPAASMLALVLVACCLGLLWLEAVLRGRARYARLGSGAARHPRRARLGAWTLPCLLLPLAVAALSLGVPAITLGRWLAAGGATIWRWGEIGPALAQTLLLAAGGAALATLSAFPMAWLSIRRPGKMQRALEGANFVSGALPGVVIALALVTIAIRVVQPLYQTLFTIMLAYALMFLPRAIIGLRASLAQAPVELEQAALVLGRSPARALCATTLRLAAPGVAAAMAMVSLGITNELTATQMLAPNGTQTLAMAFWSYSGEIDYAAAAPYALLMIFLSSPLTWLLHRQSRRTAG